MKRAFWLVLIAPLLGACVTDGTGSVANGECRVFERPPYAVRGKTQYDQDVADDFVESGVAGCKWARPAPRPPEMDAPKPVRAVAKPVKKRTLIQRVKAKLTWPRVGVATPIGLSNPEMVKPELIKEPVAEPAPPPRSDVDELLDGDE